MAQEQEEDVMKRVDIINTIGGKYLQTNIENDEWSYPKAFKAAKKSIRADLVKNHKTGKVFKNLDLRFIDAKSKVAVLVETKQDFNKAFDDAKKQLQAYVEYEKVLTGYNIIAILANTNDDQICVWRDSVADCDLLGEEYLLKSFEEYKFIFHPIKNDREEVMRNTYELNEDLNKYGIHEKLRSQLVGTCLLAIKQGMKYEGLSTSQVLAGLKQVLESLLNKNLNKAEKLLILDNRVLQDQSVTEMHDEDMQALMRTIEGKIVPYINDKNTAGQDLLNLFFTVFNKYTGRLDKNQAFSPDHIVDFMCKVVGITRHSRILDPCCGCASFLVRALTDALDDCTTQMEKDNVKANNIYGLECEDNAFGLATTNMLIHSDGNSNIKKGNLFEQGKWIEKANIDTVLMNPPYNAKRNFCDPNYVKTWKSNVSMDPSKGLHFVYEVATRVKTGKLAVLLPMQCALGCNNRDISKYKKLLLQENTLDAVFSLPSEMFYPGASVCACCMVFTLGQKHNKATNGGTFFGYFKDDGFVKKKRIGRVEMLDKKTGKGVWKGIESRWLDLYRKRKTLTGYSVVKKVTADDEWLCEAYMETPYNEVHSLMFERVVRNYLAFLVSEFMGVPALSTKNSHKPDITIDCSEWDWFTLSDYFEIKKGDRLTSEDQIPGNVPYIGAIDSNNGLSNRIAQPPQHKGNTISLSYNGSVGEAFYQPVPFWATDDVNVLYPRFEMSKWMGLYVCAILRLEKYRYCYGRKWTLELMNNTKIKLPTRKGEPDWSYMENYIKKLPYGDCI